MNKTTSNTDTNNMKKRKTRLYMNLFSYRDCFQVLFVYLALVTNTQKRTTRKNERRYGTTRYEKNRIEQIQRNKQNHSVISSFIRKKRQTRVTKQIHLTVLVFAKYTHTHIGNRNKETLFVFAFLKNRESIERTENYR